MEYLALFLKKREEINFQSGFGKNLRKIYLFGSQLSEGHRVHFRQLFRSTNKSQI